jgi:hypothetical protein
MCCLLNTPYSRLLSPFRMSGNLIACRFAVAQVSHSRLESTTSMLKDIRAQLGNAMDKSHATKLDQVLLLMHALTPSVRVIPALPGVGE